MQFTEEQNDLFNYEGKAWLAHCISADFGMGKGIATQFNEKYNLKNHMIKNYMRDNWVGRGYCIPVKDFCVFNLVTKEKYHKKPTNETLRQALVHMKEYAVAHNISTIAMPTIACGLDGMQWSIVKKLIKAIFENTDIEIIVCKL